MPSSQTTTKTSSTVRRRRKGNSGRTMIPRLLVLVFVFIAVFEGRIIHTLLTHRVSPSSSGVTATQGKTASDASQNQDKTASTPSAGAASTGSNPDQGLAGLATVSVSARPPHQRVQLRPAATRIRGWRGWQRSLFPARRRHRLILPVQTPRSRPMHPVPARPSTAPLLSLPRATRSMTPISQTPFSSETREWKASGMLPASHRVPS